MNSERIRVLHVLSCARAGGVETFVCDLARHIDQRRFQLDVCILGSGGPIVDALRATGASVHLIEDQKTYWLRALSYFIQLQAGHFEIVHINIGGRMPRYLARLARNHIVISHIHGPTPNEVLAWRQGCRSAAPGIKRNYVRGAQQIIVSSHEIARMLAGCYPDIAARMSIIPHGVDLERFQVLSPTAPHVKASRRALGLGEDDWVVGFVGRLVNQKGLSYLIDAAKLLQKRYPNIRYVIVGDGPLQAELKETTKRLFDHNRFLFLGERSDIPNLLTLFDVLAVPSEWEPFGIINLEAMAVGKPVVAFDIDGIPEAVLHRETGLLVPHRDSRALASAIAQLLDDIPLSRRMGAAGRRRVEQFFDVRNTTRRIESFYETACTAVSSSASLQGV